MRPFLWRPHAADTGSPPIHRRRLTAVATSAPAYRPRGGSLAIAVLLRFLMLPLLAGGAVALTTGVREAGIVAGGVLFGIELATFRLRWAWRTLDVLSSGGSPVESPDDVQRLAWRYGIGIALLATGVAAWWAYTDAGPEQAGRLAVIVASVALGASGFVGFEYMVRDPRRPRLRSRLGTDAELDGVVDIELLLRLVPRSLRRGAGLLFMSQAAFLGAAMGMAAGVIAVYSAEIVPAIVLVSAMMLFAPLGPALMSILEAHQATYFVGIHRS